MTGPISTATELESIHRGDRRDLGMGTANERLVGHVELGSIDRTLFDPESEIFAGQRQNRVSGDALEHALGQIRRDHLAVAHITMQAPGASATLPCWLRMIDVS